MASTRKITPKKLTSGKLARITKVPKVQVAKLTTIKYLR